MNRHYAEGAGRFNRVDPLASSARETAPQSWNRYTYAENEPIDQTDPSGLNVAICYWRLVTVVWGGEDGVFYAVIGLISEGCVDSGGGGGGGGFGTVIMPPKQAKVRPKPKPLGPARFSEEKFRACAHQLYDSSAGPSIVDRFLDSRGQGTGPYQATFDYSMTAAQIGQMLYDERHHSGQQGTDRWLFTPAPRYTIFR